MWRVLHRLMVMVFVISLSLPWFSAIDIVFWRGWDHAFGIAAGVISIGILFLSWKHPHARLLGAATYVLPFLVLLEGAWFLPLPTAFFHIKAAWDILQPGYYIGLGCSIGALLSHILCRRKGLV